MTKKETEKLPKFIMMIVGASRLLNFFFNFFNIKEQVN